MVVRRSEVLKYPWVEEGCALYFFTKVTGTTCSSAWGAKFMSFVEFAKDGRSLRLRKGFI